MKTSTQAAALSLVLLFAASGAFAQTVEQDGKNDKYSMKTQAAEHVFVQYHQAIEAKQRCSQANFSAEDLLAFDRVTASEMVAASPDVSYGAGRLLNLRRQVEDDTDHLVDREGCDGQKVKKYLAFFDERLANARPAPAAPLPGPAATSVPADAAAVPDRSVTADPQSLTPTGQP